MFLFLPRVCTVTVNVCVCVCIYIYIYLHLYIKHHIYKTILNYKNKNEKINNINANKMEVYETGYCIRIINVSNKLKILIILAINV